MNVMAYNVTEQDKKTFEQNGYWISPKLLDDETIHKLRDAHRRIWANDFDGDGYPMKDIRKPESELSLRKLDNGWWINDAVRDVVTDRNLGAMAADLLGEDSIRLWHDQVIYKPGTDGKKTQLGNVGWHQDYGYWRCCSTTNMITVWIALQDTDLSNGGMRTIVGSHEWGVVEDSDTFFDQDLEKLKQKFMQKEWQDEPCVLKAGQASFHHALTFHGSGPNLSTSPRLSIVAHLMPGHAAYQKGKGRHDNVRLLGPRPYDGQPFDNAYFPLLFER